MELDDAVYIDFAFVTLIFIVIITISFYFFRVCYFALIFAAVAASALSLSPSSFSDYMSEYLCVFVGELVADVVNINTKQTRAFSFACKNVFQNSDVFVFPRKYKHHREHASQQTEN